MDINASKIVKVLEMVRTDSDDADADFCISPVVEYTVQDGNWMILQTETDYIVLGHDGVHRMASLPYHWPEYDIFPLGDDGDEDNDPFTDFRTLLFAGQHLLDVEQDGDHYTLRFDDFQMHLYPCDEKAITSFNNSLYLPIPFYDRYLQKKCTCGGKAELMLDHVDDFIIRCDRCYQSTYACFDLESLIEDWNNGSIDGTFKTDQEDFTDLDYVHKPLNYIAIGGFPNNWNTEDACNSIILGFESAIFKIASQRTADQFFGFYFLRISAFNPELWPDRFSSDSDSVIKIDHIDYDAVPSQTMSIRIGEKVLQITAGDDEMLHLSFS